MNINSKTLASESARKGGGDISRASSTGGNKGVAMAPPDYGIGYVDGEMEVAAPVQLVGKLEEEPPLQAKSTSAPPAQRGPQAAAKSNNTGLPDNLKSGMERLSGLPLDHVKVHYNSVKPAMVQAHAYAQGSDIHLGRGQEKHLPHELGHVVQQMRGQVKATASVAGVAVNDNPILENNATAMGEKALQRVTKVVNGSDHFKPVSNENSLKSGLRTRPGGGETPGVAQRVVYVLSYKEETDESREEVALDAERIQEAYDKNGGGIVTGAEDLTKISKKYKKVVHVVGHGNRNQVGDFDGPYELHSHLKECGVPVEESMCKIVLHSCESAVQREGETKGTKIASFAEGLANVMSNTNPTPDNRSVVGMKGRVVTDNRGRSRILKEGVEEGDYKKYMQRARSQAQSMKEGDAMKFISDMVDLYVLGEKESISEFKAVDKTIQEDELKLERRTGGN